MDPCSSRSRVLTMLYLYRSCVSSDNLDTNWPRNVQSVYRSGWCNGLIHTMILWRVQTRPTESVRCKDLRDSLTKPYLWHGHTHTHTDECASLWLWQRDDRSNVHGSCVIPEPPRNRADMLMASPHFNAFKFLNWVALAESPVRITSVEVDAGAVWHFLFLK